MVVEILKLKKIMKKLIVFLLLCSVYFSYGQRPAAGNPERVAIVQGRIIPMEQMGQLRLNDLGGAPRIHMGISEEKRDSLIEIFGDILPPKELIMYIEVVPFTEEQQVARGEVGSGEPIVISPDVSGPIVVRRGPGGEPIVARGESGEPITVREHRVAGTGGQMPASLTSLFPFEVGEKVPDFTLNDVDGNPFTLSSLRGQYVVLSFWGTWCGPCIAGMPQLKEVYETYKGLVHFVGVASRERSAEVWRQTVVERFELPWINVIDEADDVTTKYGIGFWPTQILVDSEGRFVTFALNASMLSMVLENTLGGRGTRSVAVGDKAPDFTLNDVNDNPFTFSSLRGRYTLVYFWGTWCVPCIRGIPRMKEFYQQHQHNIDIVGVATRERDVESWRSEVKRLELPWINVFNDSVSAVHEKYDVGGFPTLFLVSPDGTVLLRHMGGNVGNFYEQVENIIGQ